MGLTVNLFQPITSEFSARFISSVDDSSSIQVSSSRNCFLAGARAVASPSMRRLDLLNHTRVGIESQSSNYSCNLHLNTHTLKHATNSFAKVSVLSTRKQQRMTRSALAPAATEETEYDFDSPKMKEIVAFLEKDLVHLFDDQGIDKSMYDPKVDFRDPITKYDGIDGYLFNIQVLRRLLAAQFELHGVKQTGPTEITFRWTMIMNFLLLPWKPELIFTGNSVMTVNAETGKINRHWDFWDSVQNNNYFSFEALGDLLKQMQIYKTPDLETPKYKVLKRTSLYEVRQYEEFLVAETEVDAIVTSKGFREVAGYLFGKNTTGEKMKMTTPVFNQTADNSSTLQFVLPLKSQLGSVPSPLSDKVKVLPVADKFAAIIKFNGDINERRLLEKENILRNALVKDGLAPKVGYSLARYNDPDSTWPIFRRNEVIIWLEDFALSI